MRTRQRINQSFYYRLFVSKTEIVDEYGNGLGEYDITYSDPVEYQATISPATGESTAELFGNLEQYDKIIQTCDMSCPINEESVLYIDKLPIFDEHEKVWNTHDYVVKRVARSVNTIRIAVAKVHVGNGEGAVISA